MLNPRQFPSTAGTNNQKVITPHISLAISPLSCRWGGGAVDINDWCITFTRSIGIVENLGLRHRFSTLPSGPCAMLTQWRIKRGSRGFALETMLLPNRDCSYKAKVVISFLGSLEPPLELNYFISMGNFRKK